jgi:hypothetical protein
MREMTETPAGVTQVRNIDLLEDMPTKNRLPVSVDFDVQGIGPCATEKGSQCFPLSRGRRAVVDAPRGLALHSIPADLQAIDDNSRKSYARRARHQGGEQRGLQMARA